MLQIIVKKKLPTRDIRNVPCVVSTESYDVSEQKKNLKATEDLISQ
jgi:hypothetical protein